MKHLSDQLSELSDRSKKTETSVSAALTKNRKDLERRRASLTSAINAGNKKVENQVSSTERKIQAQWSDTRSSPDDQFDMIRDHPDKRHNDKGVKKAKHHADVAEQHAADAISLVFYILDRAEYAIVDAALARADADELVAAK
jgi:hypothetical protein